MNRIDHKAREHGEHAIKVLAEIMDDPFAEDKDRIKAADSILDRGYGKAKDATIMPPLSREQAKQLAGMSDSDLLAIIRQPIHSLADMRREAVDVSFEVVTEGDPLLA